MDILSYQKAIKAKKEIQKVRDRLGLDGTQNGLDVTDKFKSVDKRLKSFEKIIPEIFVDERISRISEHTAINLHKYNLKVRSLLNQRKYQLENMIVDDFGNNLGYDSSKSTNINFSTGQKKAKQSNLDNSAEFVTRRETLDKSPSKFSISLAVSHHEIEMLKYGFTEDERELFTKNDLVIFDGAAHLKKEFQEELKSNEGIDDSYLFKKDFSTMDFKSINSIFIF